MLAVASIPADGGTVAVSPVAAKYLATAEITLTAVPAAGFVFVEWTGEIDGIADPSWPMVAFVMGANLDKKREIAANFITSDLRHTVSPTSKPSGGGSVILQPVQPAQGYLVNESISLFASAKAGYVFSHWAGDLAGDQNPNTILVSEDKFVSAVFNPTVRVYCSPSEGGSVTIDPESISGYSVGTLVALSVRPAKGYRFVAWEGDVSGSARSIAVTVDDTKTITARFAEEPASRWWLWGLLGVAGMFGVLALLRVVYSRMHRQAWEEP